MAALVIDLETHGKWDDLPPSVQAALEARQKPERPARESCALSPYTGRVVVLGVRDVTASRSVVLYVMDDGRPPVDTASAHFEGFANERELLTSFWERLRDTHAPLVGFNSRRFDLPFLAVRSLVAGVPMKRSPMAKPWETRGIVDLAEIVAAGDAKEWRPSLELACHAFGIESPKAGMHGSEVARAIDENRVADVAEYNAEDLRATAALYGRLVPMIELWR